MKTVWLIITLAALLLCMFYPFFPGEYDTLSMPLSALVQATAVFGLLLVPLGVLWLFYDAKQRTTSRRAPIENKSYRFAVVSLVAGSVVVLLPTMAVLFGTSKAFGMVVLAAWCYFVKSRVSKLRRGQRTNTGIDGISAAPIYLVCLPITLVLAQCIFAKYLTDRSRQRAIAHSVDISHPHVALMRYALSCNLTPRPDFDKHSMEIYLCPDNKKVRAMTIICIDDHFTPEQIAEIPHRPVRDKIYTIRDVVKSANGIGLLLNEIHNPHTGWVVRNGMKFTFEPNFNIRRFSDLQNQPLSYEMLRAEVFADT